MKLVNYKTWCFVRPNYAFKLFSEVKRYFLKQVCFCETNSKACKWFYEKYGKERVKRLLEEDYGG